jgi:hypothetical protein
MTRSRTGLAIVLVVAFLLTGGAVAAPPSSLEDVLWDLQIVPLDPEPAAPLSLPATGGDRVSLADLRGRVVVLYFWIST